MSAMEFPSIEERYQEAEAKRKRVLQSFGTGPEIQKSNFRKSRFFG